jgi:uncharacterized protein YjiS (DUF1127 family)
MTDAFLEISGNLPSPQTAAGERHAWLSAQLCRFAGRARRWMRRDESRRALAEVEDDHLNDLSEIGRQVRREERRRSMSPQR